MDVKKALGVQNPVFDLFDERIQLLHAISVEEAPLCLHHCATMLGYHFLR